MPRRPFNSAILIEFKCRRLVNSSEEFCSGYIRVLSPDKLWNGCIECVKVCETICLCLHTFGGFQ
jgi:hypothetical protein